MGTGEEGKRMCRVGMGWGDMRRNGMGWMGIGRYGQEWGGMREMRGKGSDGEG